MFPLQDAALAAANITTRDITNLRLAFATDKMMQAYGLPYHYLAGGIVWPVPDLAGIDTGDRIYQCFYSRQSGMIAAPEFARPASPMRPRLYFCPLVDWQSISPTQDIYLCGNPVQAVQHAKRGRYSIGLINIIDGWRTKAGALNPDFLLLPWRERKMILAPEIKTSTHVITALASQLRLANISLHRDMHSTREQTQLERILSDMNDYLFHLAPSNYILDAAKPTLNLHQSYYFRTEYPADKIYLPSADGKRIRSVNLALEWLRWPGHNVIEGLTFNPEEPKIINKNKHLYFNCWAHSSSERAANRDRYMRWTRGRLGQLHRMQWRQLSLV